MQGSQCFVVCFKNCHIGKILRIANKGKNAVSLVMDGEISKEGKD